MRRHWSMMRYAYVHCRKLLVSPYAPCHLQPRRQLRAALLGRRRARRRRHRVPDGLCGAQLRLLRAALHRRQLRL